MVAKFLNKNDHACDYWLPKIQKLRNKKNKETCFNFRIHNYVLSGPEKNQTLTFDIILS